MDKANFPRKRRLPARIMSLFLCAVMLFGLVPAVTFEAQAVDAPNQVTLVNGSLTGFGRNNYQYDSVCGLGRPYIHGFTVNNGISSFDEIAFCLDHDKHMNDAANGKPWDYVGPASAILPADVLRFLDYYYAGIDNWEEASKTQNTPNPTNPNPELPFSKPGDRIFWNAPYQAAIWLGKAGKMDGLFSDPVKQKMIADEMAQICKANNNGSYGQQTPEWCLTYVQNIINFLTKPDSPVPHFEYYQYHRNGPGDYQDLLVRIPGNPPQHTPVYVKIKKVNENNQPLPGALFGVFTDAACNNQIGVITTGNDEWSVSGAINLTASGRVTLYIKELHAPGAYEVSRDVESVTVDTAVNNTADNAAAVIHTWKNYRDPPPGDPGTPSSSDGNIRKVDKYTNKGVGPATFHIEGNADPNQGLENPPDRPGTKGYWSGDLTTDNKGNLNIQWKDPRGENYVPPGTYTVTEKTPPEGYALTTEARHLVLVYDPDTGLATSSGELVFENAKYHKIIIKKVGEDGNTGLPGAVFDLYHDGNFVTSVTTDDSGSFTYSGKDNNGVADGLWTIIEKTPPTGYVLPYDYWQQVLVDSSDLTVSDHIVSFQNFKWPEIVIKKLDVDTGRGLGGAVFEVMVDGNKFGTVPTSDDGTIVINYETYGQYWNMDNREHTVAVREVTPPPGYMISDADWQINKIVEGQTLSTFTFTDKAYPKIQILKLDRETGEPLPNCSFRVLIDGTNFEDERRTDENGLITYTYEEYGRFLEESDQRKDSWTVTVTEVEPPANYNRDKQLTSGDYTQTQQLKFGQDITKFEFKDTSFRDIKVIKKDAETNWPLKGASFTLHLVHADDPKVGANVTDRVLTTDGTGTLVFKDVPNGTYELYESSAPYGYSKNGHWGDGEMSAKRTVIVTSSNDPVIEFEYYNEPLSGLLIRKIDSVTKQPIPNVRFRIRPLFDMASWEDVTDDNGVIVRESLPKGSYEIQEVATVDGYVLNSEPQTVIIDEQHDAYTVTFENNQKNMLNVLKLDAITKLPLAGAIFEVSTAGGTHVANITTGIYGYANLPNLKPGSYVVKEILAPDDHIIDPVPQTFEIRDDDSGQVITLVFDNSPYANLYIRKYDEFTNIGLEGATFKVMKGSGEIVVDNAKTDAQGFIHVGELTEGTYLIQETAAPRGYLLDSSTHEVFLKNGQTKTVEIANKKPGGVAVRKVDAKTGAALQGAEFELRTLEGTLISTKRTTADGYARWEQLDPGWYVLKETKAPAGYAINNPDSRNVQVKEFESTELTWENNQDASLTITKRDKDSEVPLAGAIFEIRTMTGDLVEEVTTGSNGIATTGRLKPAWYRIIETKAPDGYVLNEEEMRVEIKDNTPVSVSFYNESKKGIVIHKVDAVTEEPLAGAVFEVRTASNKLVESYTTDASGTVTTKALEPGYYNVVEVKAPTGYVLNEEPQMVHIEEAGEQGVVTFKNFPETIIQIYKTDSATGDPLEYVEFEIQDGKGNAVTFVTTDKTGWANTRILAPGDYIVKETKAAVGYTLDTTEHRVTIEPGKNVILRLTNDPATSLHISKVDKATRQPLAGAEFELRCDTGHGDCTYIGTYVTDELGMIHTEPLKPGFYMIKETVAPEGYDILKEEVRYCVKAGEYNHVVIEDTALGSLVVRKIDSVSGKPVAGAVFKLENADTSDLVGLLETDAQGEAIWTGLKEGFYIVTETQAPDGYNKQPCSKTVQVEYGKRTYVDFKDDENGSLKIVLQDKTTGKYLAGGHFTVTRESDQIVIFDGSTDTTGTIVVGNLVPGWYTVTQTFAPDKYTMVDITTKVEVLIGQEQTVYFKDVTAGMVIEKVDAQYPTLMLEGARFQVKRDVDGIVVGEYVTGKDGLAMVDGLEPGLYTVSELVAPVGYALSAEPKTVHVKEGTTAHVTFLDTALSSITVNIVDVNTQLPIPGAVVEVWNQNGTLVNTYTSDATGVIQTDKLPAGHYVLKLISVPDGYSVSASASTETTVELVDGVETTLKFELSMKGSLKIMSVDKASKALSGMSVSITKLDGAKVGHYTTGSDGSITVNDLAAGWYMVTETKAPDGHSMSATVEQRVEVTGKGVASLTFQHSRIYGLQITTTCKESNAKIAGVVYKVKKLDGSIVGTYTSGSDGLVFIALEPGWYAVTPKSVPSGYSLTDGLTKNIEVKGDSLTTMELFVSKMASIRVKIVDGASRSGIYNVRLQLKNSGNCIKEFCTNNEGYITIDAGLLSGGFTLEMISAPSGYIVDKVPKSISALAGQTTDIVWALYKEGGQIQVVVTSADYNKTLDKPAGTGLAGAVFEIMNADTYQVVGQMISNASGVAASSGLPIGRYMVKMVSAPAYYGVNQSFNPEVRLKINNDVVRVETTVSSVTIDSNITLKSNTSVRAGSNMRVDIVSAKNGSDVRLDNFYLHIKVPTDAARITTLSTGKWNASVAYSISYKTNMSDYRILAQNLLSSNVYQYGLSTQSLGLQAGEYVTDVRFEFGTVPSGFATVEKPCFTQYVLATVYNGYKLISRVEMGGQHNTVNVSTTHIDNNNPFTSTGGIVIVDSGHPATSGGTGTAVVSGNSGQWTTSSGLWTTTVSSNVKAPATLPKTGY